ncbi:MAG: hypothetical protein ACLFUB_07945 [Cyclobacteriaceae bacterium]
MRNHFGKYSILLLSFIFLLMACSEDDETTQEDLLYGTWEIQSSELTAYSFTGSFLFFSGEIDQDNIRSIPVLSDYANDLEDTLKAAVDEALPPGTTLTINENNDYTLNSNSYLNGGGTWATEGNQLILNVDVDNEPFQLAYNIEQLIEDQLIVVLTVDEQKLAELTGGVIELTYEGVTIDEYSLSYTFNFTKQQQ